MICWLYKYSVFVLSLVLSMNSSGHFSLSLLTPLAIFLRVLANQKNAPHSWFVVMAQIADIFGLNLGVFWP